MDLLEHILSFKQSLPYYLTDQVNSNALFTLTNVKAISNIEYASLSQRNFLKDIIWNAYWVII
jgi:hypothetical protein